MNKPVLPTPHFDAVADQQRAILEHDGKRHDPFSPPYVPSLHLGDLRDEEEGVDYAVLVSRRMSSIPDTLNSQSTRAVQQVLYRATALPPRYEG